MSNPKSPFLTGIRITMALCAIAILGKVGSNIHNGLTQKPSREPPKHPVVTVCIEPDRGLFTGEIDGVVMFKNGKRLPEGGIYNRRDMALKTENGQTLVCFDIHLIEPLTPKDSFSASFVYNGQYVSPRGNEYLCDGLFEEMAVPSVLRIIEPRGFDPLQGVKSKYSPNQPNYVYKIGRGKKAFIFP